MGAQGPGCPPSFTLGTSRSSQERAAAVLKAAKQAGSPDPLQLVCCQVSQIFSGLHVCSGKSPLDGDKSCVYLLQTGEEPKVQVPSLWP